MNVYVGGALFTRRRHRCHSSLCHSTGFSLEAKYSQRLLSGPVLYSLFGFLVVGCLFLKFNGGLGEMCSLSGANGQPLQNPGKPKNAGADKKKEGQSVWLIIFFI